MSKHFKDNIICHSAYRNQGTLLALFHLSARVLLLQQHWKMKRSNVQKMPEGTHHLFQDQSKGRAGNMQLEFFFS